ncbi:MAG TPA: 3-oxoacyl-[acyl-carrier-protein] synthase III C-terminal domain-containing protein [Myxococcales bacterium]|jgi:3-oxoacyl-[acyl-carrier-protein] synthase-3|nr:3-oxoacyl-[acyl-carrier-protein] synthase III C-terminal domain-containing protein [Myxococcales bacterium]
MLEPSTCGLTALGYHLPPEQRSVEDLAHAGLVSSTAERLRKFGHQFCRVAGDTPVEVLAREAVADLQRRSGFDLTKVDLVVYGAGLATSQVVDPGHGYGWMQTTNPSPLLKFPGPKLAASLSLSVPVIGVSQLACNTLQGVMRVARGLLAAEPPLRNILMVVADRLPPQANRELVYTVLSDGACAAVMSRRSERHRLLSCAQVTRGGYWDNEGSRDQLIAHYFPLARQAFEDALAGAGLKAADLKMVIPHNLNLKSWEVLAKVLGVPIEKVFTRNIAAHGHAVAVDNLSNYVDAVSEGALLPGDKVAWFVNGFGAHWSALVMEV